MTRTQMNEGTPTHKNVQGVAHFKVYFAFEDYLHIPKNITSEAVVGQEEALSKGNKVHSISIG